MQLVLHVFSVHFRKVMKPLSIILALLITTVALITYAAEQSEPEEKESQVKVQTSIEKPKAEEEPY